MRLIVLLMFASVAAFGQAVGSSYYHWSDDGSNIYGSTTVEASMYIINPPPNVTHIYTAAFTLKGPKGATVNAVPVQISEGIYGTEWPVANAEISMANSGFYYLDTSDTAYCSYIEEDFFADNGTDWPIIPQPYIMPGGVADNYTYTNSFAVDSAGTMSIYGESLLCEGSCNQAEIQVYENDDPNVTIEAITSATDQQINVGYSIGSGATVGEHCLYVSTPYGVSNCGSYMIGDFSPTISSISSTSFVAGTSTPNVQISGQNFGTNCPRFAVTPALAGTSFTPTNCTDTVVTGTMNIDPSAVAGQDTVSLTAEGFNGQGFLPAQPGETQSATTTITVTLPPPPDQFNVSYMSYIPVDHVNGPDTCLYTAVPVGLIYKGDLNRGTFRTAESVLAVPDSRLYTNQSVQTGTTENYGFGSPVHPPNLSSADEDAKYNDCYLANAIGQASTSGMSVTVSFPGSHAATAGLSGSAGNPLVFLTGYPITWNMAVSLNDAAPSAPTAYVIASHTCYPAHTVTVNRTTIYSYQPPSNSLSYITGCLTGNGYIGPVTGNTYQVPTK